MPRSLLPVLLLALLAASCAGGVGGPAGGSSPGSELPTHAAEQEFRRTAPEVAEEGAASPSSPDAPTPSPDTVLATEPPVWLGTRVLPPGEGGYGMVVPTPPELEDRRIRTRDVLPPPEDGFESTVGPVPDDVLARSTWSADCPVGADELVYVTVSHWGFDGDPHTGELLVHRDVADDLTTVLRAAWEDRFAIEEMRIVSPADLEAPPTGDGNNTTAFVCRPVRGSQRWSEHAFGRAIDINPFHNPYVKGTIVLPELASAYTDRDWRRPGMLFAEDAVVSTFEAVGWHWGGTWQDPIDWMHFSRDGG